MSTADVNGSALIDGRVTLRLQGAWEAFAVVETTDPADVTGAVSIAIGDTTLKGTATPLMGADAGNRVTLRIVGGAGGLGAAVTAKDYSQPTRRAVAQAILGDGGEALSATSDSAVLDVQLPRWTTLAGTVGDALWSLVEAAGAHWRVLGDGSIWIGTETWPAVTDDEVVVEDEQPSESRIDVALEEMTILPGSSFNEQNISTATYTIDGSSMRAALYYGHERGATEELLGTFVQRETAHRDFEAKYLAKAVSQNSDGTLELQPYDSRVPPMSKVAVKLGIPGVVTYKIQPPLDVVVEFENGSPAGAVVTNFLPGTAQELALAASVALKLGSANASDPVVTESRLVQAFATHVHTSAAPGSPTTVPTAPLSNIGSPKVLAD